MECQIDQSQEVNACYLENVCYPADSGGGGGGGSPSNNPPSNSGPQCGGCDPTIQCCL